MITPEEITLYLICINQRHICIFKTLIKLAPQINIFTEHVKSHNETWSYRRKETLWMITQQIWNYMYIVIMFISFGLRDTFYHYTIIHLDFMTLFIIILSFIWTSWHFLSLYYHVCFLSITFQYIKKNSDLKIFCKVCENKLLFV